MHEFALATQIVESVGEFVDAQPAGRDVFKVRLWVGELAGIEPEQLRFCYNAITRETPLEHSVLEISMAPAQVRCSSCGYEGAPKYLNGAFARAKVATLQCPRCGKSVEATVGHECELKAIEFVEAKLSPPLPDFSDALANPPAAVRRVV